MIIQAIHKYDEAHVRAVMHQMQAMGAPIIRACVVAHDEARALEGVHRLESAKRLGITPVIEIVDRDILISDLALDWQDAWDGATVGDMLDWFESTGEIYCF